MKLLKEEKVFRDPIHGYVRVKEEVVWKCIATKEFQRLRRIKQLGSTSSVYHCGEHSRFSHSLGVYEIVRRMVTEVADLNQQLTDYEKVTAMLAGLLHDIGHAPFSHSFESIMKVKHEELTVQIILSDSEVSEVLSSYDSNLPKDVASVISGDHPNQILCQLVSSQLDADRMDYLLRDSYFTGTKYGEFDLERILRTLRVADGKLVVKESGMHTIEDYIMARYHMYWQVYYHSVSRSFDALLNKLFVRLRDLYQDNPDEILNKLPMYKALLTKDSLSNHDHYLLDDSCCYYSLHLMEEMDDKILSDIARRILERDLLDSAETQEYENIVERLNQAGFDPKYYLSRDRMSQNPYKPYSDNESHSIWVLRKDGSIIELSHISHIVSAIAYNNDFNDELLFFPKGV